MGMGIMPPSRDVVLKQAKGERDTLNARIAVTESSIAELESALEYAPDFEGEPAVMTHLRKIERRISSLINVNLIQLKGSLKEGQDRVAFLNEGIRQAESPIQPAAGMRHTKR